MWVVIIHLYIIVGEVTQYCTFLGSMPGEEWFAELQALNETRQVIMWSMFGFKMLNIGLFVKPESCFLRISLTGRWGC